MTRAADLQSRAADVHVTLLSLPNDAVVEAVVFGPQRQRGLLDGTKRGDVVFDVCTVNSNTPQCLAKRAGERGVKLIDAPVSSAVALTLALMVGAMADQRPRSGTAGWTTRVCSLTLSRFLASAQSGGGAHPA